MHLETRKIKAIESNFKIILDIKKPYSHENTTLKNALNIQFDTLKSLATL